MPELTLPQVYRRAVEVLDERGWCQGRYVDETGCLCAGGALGVALGATPNFIPDDAEAPALRTWIGMHGDVEDQWITAIAHLIHVLGRSVSGFNDAPGRTVDEVRAALLRAAEEAERDA